MRAVKGSNGSVVGSLRCPPVPDHVFHDGDHGPGIYARTIAINLCVFMPKMARRYSGSLDPLFSPVTGVLGKTSAHSSVRPSLSNLHGVSSFFLFLTTWYCVCSVCQYG